MDKNYKAVKRVLKTALLVEVIVFIAVLLLTDTNCKTNCFAGLNNGVLYVFPFMGVTFLMYLYIKTNELVSNKTSLGSNKRTLYIVAAIIVSILLIFGIYVIRNT